jgi:hypothetical protein
MRLQAGAPDIDIGRVLEIVGNLINRPGFIAGSLFYIALIVPLVEEIIKPIGVWLLAGRRLTPVEGLVIGMISGAGFALFENLMVFEAETVWYAVLLARMTTTTIHVFTSGLMGWALVQAWQSRRYLRLLAMYVLVVLIHGIWNAAAALLAISNLLHSLTKLENPPVLPYHLQANATILMVIMSITCFILLILLNRKMKAKVVVEYAAGSAVQADNIEGD